MEVGSHQVTKMTKSKNRCDNIYAAAASLSAAALLTNGCQLEIVPEPFLVLFWPGITSDQSSCRTFFVPEPEHAEHFLCS